MRSCVHFRREAGSSICEPYTTLQSEVIQRHVCFLGAHRHTAQAWLQAAGQSPRLSLRRRPRSKPLSHTPSRLDQHMRAHSCRCQPQPKPVAQPMPFRDLYPHSHPSSATSPMRALLLSNDPRTPPPYISPPCSQNVIQVRPKCNQASPSVKKTGAPRDEHAFCS